MPIPAGIIKTNWGVNRIHKLSVRKGPRFGRPDVENTAIRFRADTFRYNRRIESEDVNRRPSPPLENRVIPTSRLIRGGSR